MVFITPGAGWLKSAGSCAALGVLLLALVATVGIGSGQGQTNCVIPPTGMVAWYPLDEPAGANAVNDIAPPPDSAFNNVGTPAPGPVNPPGPGSGPAPVTGLVGGALYFYGPHVVVPPHTELDFGMGDFSIDAWVRAVQCGPGFLSPIVDKFDPTTNTGFSFYLEQNPPSTAFLKLRINASTFTSTGSFPATANPMANTGPWVHVAVTVNRTTGAGTFYINGAPAGTFAVPPGNITNTLSMLIGEVRVPGGRCEIAVDELELSNRELSATEIQNIVNAGPAGKCKKSVLGNEPLQCTPPQVTTALQAGENDNFNPDPDTPPAAPAPNFVAATGITLPAGFDSTSIDRHFLHSFTGLPSNITSAQLEIRLRPLSGDSSNDALNLWGGAPITLLESHFLGSGNAQTGLLTQTWDTANFFPNGHVFLLNLSPAVVSSMNAHNALHIQVQDDTSVDYVILRLCARPEGTAEICVFKFEDLDGDGVRGPNEPLLPGWTFTVAPSPPSSVTTGPQGGICFGVAAPGTYTITEQVQSGWTPTTPNPQTVTVQPGQLVNVSFGNRKKEEAKCDLAIRKTVTPSPVGVQVTITLTVPAGQTCAPGTVVVQDLQPTGMTFLSGSLSVSPATHWSCTLTPNLSCTNTVTLTGAYTATFTFTATVQPGIPIENCATATVSGQLISRSCVPVQIAPPLGKCDLQITKSVSPNPVNSGQPVTVTLTVTNVGNGPCGPDTVVQDPPTPGLSVILPPALVSQSGGTATWSCISLAGNVQCVTASTLPAGYSATFTFTATPTVAPPPGGSVNIQNCATVNNPNDPLNPMNPGNNQSCVTITVRGVLAPIDLTLAKLLDGVLRPEAEVTYVLRVTNVGGAATRAPIRVTDPLPPQLRFIAATGAGWSCSVSGQNVICTNAARLAPAQSGTILLRVRVVAAPGTQITNCATVETEGDANPANNRGCHTGTVQR